MERASAGNGGTDPVWRPKGGEIYYRNGDQMMAVTITDPMKLAVSKPVAVWKGGGPAAPGDSGLVRGPEAGPEQLALLAGVLGRD